MTWKRAVFALFAVAAGTNVPTPLLLIYQERLGLSPRCSPRCSAATPPGSCRRCSSPGRCRTGSAGAGSRSPDAAVGARIAGLRRRRRFAALLFPPGSCRASSAASSSASAAPGWASCPGPPGRGPGTAGGVRDDRGLRARPADERVARAVRAGARRCCPTSCTPHWSPSGWPRHPVARDGRPARPPRTHGVSPGRSRWSGRGTAWWWPPCWRPSRSASTRSRRRSSRPCRCWSTCPRAGVAVTGVVAGVTLGAGTLVAPLQRPLGRWTAVVGAALGAPGSPPRPPSRPPGLPWLVAAAPLLGAGGGLCLAAGLTLTARLAAPTPARRADRAVPRLRLPRLRRPVRHGGRRAGDVGARCRWRWPPSLTGLLALRLLPVARRRQL